MVRLAQTMHPSRLTLSPYILKRASTSPMSPRGTIRCIQTDFLSLWCVWRKPCTYLASRLTLSPNWLKQASTWPTSPMSFIGCAPKWLPSLLHVRLKPCTYLASRLTLSPNELKRATPWPTSPGVPSGTAKMISMPMVHSAQTMHLSCADINTISKRNKISFHLTHVVLEFHRVHQKRLPCLFHVWCKPCN